MKIVFTTDTLARGGKERQLSILTSALLNENFEISIVAKQFSNLNYLNEYEIDKKIINIYSGNSLYKKYLSFKNIINSQKPDILISWDTQSSFFALLLYKKYHIKFINASIQHGIRLFKVSQLIRSLICYLSPNIIANSLAGLKANNLKLGNYNFLLYNGIENKFNKNLTISEINLKRDELLPEYKNKPGIIYVTVANMVPYKDYFTVLKAMRNLKLKQQFYYIIIGDGPMRLGISNIIRDYNLEENVILLGKIENVNDILSLCDIMIHSSKGEGVSNAILEGMFAGLPIVATNVGGIPETVFSTSSKLFIIILKKLLYK